MKIQLIDLNKKMCKQWKCHFKNDNDVIVHHGEFFSLPTDCVVSPANSFGFMDGGLDLLISEKLGWHIEYKLQKRIQEKYFGELLVGQAELIETNVKDIPFCISAPTMRVPMVLKDTVNVYLASKAIFYLLKNVNAEHRHSYGQDLINTVTISGLGTGVGQVPFDICAKQMKQGYIDGSKTENRLPLTWEEAEEQHQMLYC